MQTHKNAPNFGPIDAFNGNAESTPFLHIKANNDTPSSPLTVVCPHAGIWFPKGLEPDLNVSIQEVLSRGDRHTDALSSEAPNIGANLIISTVTASFLNVGRRYNSIHPDDVRGSLTGLETDPQSPYVNKGQGLVAVRTLLGDQPIYKPGRNPTAQDIVNRTNQFHAPFHKDVHDTVERNIKQHGLSLMFDIHSCNRYAPPTDIDAGLERPDIILGDINGQSCDPRFIKTIQQIGEQHGFSVVLNIPYIGGYNTHEYGLANEKYQGKAHSLQIEWSRYTPLGINEDTFEMIDIASFQKAKECHTDMIAALAEDARNMAAEIK